MKHSNEEKNLKGRFLINCTRREIGDLGEQIVAKYLQNKGYTVLAKNYRKPWGELDVVSVFENKIYICEVKTVLNRTISDARPEELINPRKIMRIVRATHSFFNEKGNSRYFFWQLDAFMVSVFISEKGQIEGGKIKRIPNIVGV